MRQAGLPLLARRRVRRGPRRSGAHVRAIPLRRARRADVAVVVLGGAGRANVRVVLGGAGRPDLVAVVLGGARRANVGVVLGGALRHDAGRRREWGCPHTGWGRVHQPGGGWASRGPCGGHTSGGWRAAPRTRPGGGTAAAAKC